MGYGSWSSSSYDNYTKTTYGVSAMNFADADYTAQEMYKSRSLAKVLDPKNIMRECCDSEEHPESFPVILALDVTGSMGGASVKVAQRLNEIMTDLYADPDVKDVQFCVMGIGDLAYDWAPIQMSQFESDIRIAEQLDKIYFEAGGGGNNFESYSAAWYMGVNHCKLDCWNRGKKGVIITMGDELPNPYLFGEGLVKSTGDKLQGNIETKELLAEALTKFDIYHIAVDDRESSYRWYVDRGIDDKWKALLGDDHYNVSNLDNLSATITGIIKNCAKNGSVMTTSNTSIQQDENNEVIW